MGDEARTDALPKSAAKTGRLLSLDAYRGFTMLAMVSAGLRMGHLKNDPTWGWLADQLDHRRWEGCTAWDLIQPSFMFIVGVAMPYSYARRREQGDNWGLQFRHALQRCVLLAGIGIFLDCYSERTIYVQFIRVLQQIALAYPLVFLVLHRGALTQALTALAILFVHPLAFMLFNHWSGVAGDPWAVQYNFGRSLDAILHLPLSVGGYVTFNAFSSAATILFGVLCGELLRGRWPPAVKLLVLIAAGLAGLWIGWELTACVPMIKRLWTTSFAVFAAGWTCLMMAGFYLVIDMLRLQRWAFPFTVVGMNSIASYVFSGIGSSVVQRGLSPFLEPLLPPTSNAFPIVMAMLVVVVNFLFCYWLYRRRIFFRV
jgi:heparan-alpha-glucosaminide N-acetyltransferase